MSTRAEPLVHYLRELEARGQTHVSVDDEARGILRAFYMRALDQPVSTPPQPPQQKSTPPEARTQFSELPPELPADPPTQPAVSAPTTHLQITGNNAKEKIESLRKQAEKWQPARALKSLRQTMVFSAGNPEADVMLVGEAPGYDEERLHEPFVGKAGQKLDGILRAMGIERKQCYLSHIVKFRPSMPNQTTNNRKPTPEELAVCMPFIEHEVDIVKPKVIVALGGTAAQALLASDSTVTQLRGSFHHYQGIPLRVTYHPSYILHNEATTEKRKLWEDMLEIMRLLEIPISDKQQGYFLPK